MADTIVSFVSDYLTTLLLEERSLLGGLRHEVELIKDSLGHMKAFLEVAEAKEDDDPRLQVWVKQVREAAYDIEDVLGEFVLRFGGHRHHGFCGSLQRILNAIKSLRARHQLASEIQSIKSRIDNSSKEHQRFQDELRIQDHVTGSSTMKDSWRFSRDDALLVEEAKLVGIDQPKQHLISKLLEGDNHRLKVISVVGMGGLGKTTLVQKVHEDPDVKKHFPVRAWVTVSQTCDFPKLLRDLISQLHRELNKSVPQFIESISTTELKKFVKNFLQQAGRYAIVFDDVWDVEFWSAIKFALPESNYGNRVILTTRKADVASASCAESQDYVYKMKPLPIEDSWALFCNKIFKENRCPAYLIDVANGVLDKCEGLPLAILAISGLLASKDVSRIDEWEMVLHTLGGELEGTGKLERVKRILSLSYNDLPSYLKPCLLYLSIYPEDYAMSCTRMIQLWIAERFVEQREGMSVEDVARVYLNELINRSLIQVNEVFYEGLPDTCRIHDLLREVILLKSKEHNMVTVTTGRSMTWPSEKIRRLVVHSSFNDNYIQQRQYHCFKHLRSFITIGSMNPLQFKTLSSEVLGNSKLLKVLNLKGQKIEEIPDEIFKSFHLKHLNLWGTRVERVPKAIGKLHHLEYLNLGNTEVTELPVEILKLGKLQHLIVYKQVFSSEEDYRYYGFKGPSKLGGLFALQVLDTIDASSGSIIVKEIGKLTQLRELCITELRREDGEELCSSLANLTGLRELSVASIEKGDDYEIIDLNHHHPSLSSSSSSSSSLFLQSLRFLTLRGRLEKMPQWVAHLHSLVRIDLYWSWLRGEEDPLESLQHLPNLNGINFRGSYQAEGLCFKAGGFLKLKDLGLRSMKGLRWIRVEEGALPRLQTLWLERLPLLEDLPSGIQHLSHLQELSLYKMSSQLIEKADTENLEEDSEDYKRIAHIPEIFIGSYATDTDNGEGRFSKVWGKRVGTFLA